MPRLPEPEVSIPEKIYNLYKELMQAEIDRKESAKAHSDNIKRIKDELKDTLDAEDEDVTAAQKAAVDD